MSNQKFMEGLMKLDWKKCSDGMPEDARAPMLITDGDDFGAVNLVGADASFIEAYKDRLYYVDLSKFEKPEISVPKKDE